MTLNQTHIISVSKKNITFQTDQDFKEKIFVQKLSKFVEMKKIGIENFWNFQRNYASSEDICAFCQNIELKLDTLDQINLKEQMFLQQQVISIYDFCQQIPYWKQNCQEKVTKFMKEKHTHLSSSKILKETEARQKSNSVFKIVRKSSAIKSGQSSTNKVRSKSQVCKGIKSISDNSSKKYLTTYKKSSDKQQTKLAQLINQNKRQSQYVILSKVTQLNGLTSKLNLNTIFKVYKNQQNDIQVRVFTCGLQVRSIKPQNLDKQIKYLKDKEKAVNSIVVKEKMIQSGVNFGQNISANPENKNHPLSGAKVQTRQQQLKNLLVKTVNLTNLLKEQLLILKQKNVYGAQNID